MNIVSKAVFGSHLYHLNTELSDTDYKAIYVPEYRDIILGKDKKNITSSTGNASSKNTKDDEDFEVFSLKEFVKLACQGQTVAIDYLHVTDPIIDSPIHQYLVDNRTKFYSKNMNAFMGYVKKQASKYGLKGSKLAVLEKVLAVCDHYLNIADGEQPILRSVISKLPITEFTKLHTSIRVSGVNNVEDVFYVVNGSMMHDVIPLNVFRDRIQKQYDNFGERAIQAKNNNNIDWKAISHALRAGYQLRDIFLKGDFEYPLKQTQFLLDVKQGKLDYITEVAPELEYLVENLAGLAKNANLPDEVDVAFWDDFVYNVYTGNFNRRNEMKIRQTQ